MTEPESVAVMHGQDEQNWTGHRAQAEPRDWEVWTHMHTTHAAAPIRCEFKRLITSMAAQASPQISLISRKIQYTCLGALFCF